MATLSFNISSKIPIPYKNTIINIRVTELAYKSKFSFFLRYGIILFLHSWIVKNLFVIRINNEDTIYAKNFRNRN